jgi:hypothetical protein
MCVDGPQDDCAEIVLGSDHITLNLGEPLVENRPEICDRLWIERFVRILFGGGRLGFSTGCLHERIEK